MSRIPGSPRLLVLAILTSLGLVASAHATTTMYMTDLSGANEEPPNGSTATGQSVVYVDDVGHTMRVVVSFAGLTGTTTACHIHAATSVPGEGTAGVATPTPTFPGFPAGVTSGSYDQTFDMTDPASYNPAFLTAHGGDPAAAEAYLFQSIANGTAYLNVHTTEFPAGEIRGFYTNGTVATTTTTWGGIKAAFE
jgi:hypothetical protein